MKNILLLILMSIFVVSCGSGEPKTRNKYFEGDFVPIKPIVLDEIVLETDSVVVKEIQYKYKPSVIEDDGIISYWFVRVTDSKGSTWTNVVIQNHSYISLKEVQKTFASSSKYNPDKVKNPDVFIISFIQVSEATYIDYSNE